MRTVRKKSIATRSPSACPLPYATTSPKAEQQEQQHKRALLSSSFEAHNLPPGTFGSTAMQSLIYATSNDRFPGAPGTLLHRAKLEAARALAAKQREIQRDAERREEMKRLGILGGIGKKRSSANGRFATSPVASDRARRSNAVAAAANANGASAATSNVSTSSATSTNGGGGSSTRPARTTNGRNVAANAIDHNALPTPSSAQNGTSTQLPSGASSPLLSASGRHRRPATGSRGASPMPSTGVNGTTAASAITTSGGMITRTRSPIVPSLDLDDVKDASEGPALIADGQSVLA